MSIFDFELAIAELPQENGAPSIELLRERWPECRILLDRLEAQIDAAEDAVDVAKAETKALKAALQSAAESMGDARDQLRAPTFNRQARVKLAKFLDDAQENIDV